MLDSLTPEARSLSLVPLRRGSIIASSIISYDQHLFISLIYTDLHSTVEPADCDVLRTSD
jgi:hypothetical protein